MHRRPAALLAATIVATSLSLSVGEARAATVAPAVACGATITRLPAGPGPLGNKRWDIYYRNCSSSTVHRKVDIANSADLPCVAIGAGVTHKWHYETGYFGPDYPRSVPAC